MFLDCVRTYLATPNAASARRTKDAARAQVHRHEPTAKQILRRLDPALAGFDFDRHGGWDAEGNTVRGLGVLEDMDEWAARLEPDAPALSADLLHPWIWGAAASSGSPATTGRPSRQRPLRLTRMHKPGLAGGTSPMTSSYRKPSATRTHNPGSRVCDVPVTLLTRPCRAANGAH